MKRAHSRIHGTITLAATKEKQHTSHSVVQYIQTATMLPVAEVGTRGVNQILLLLDEIPSSVHSAWWRDARAAAPTRYI